MLKLVVQNGPEAGRHITVASEVTVGRENADLTIPEREVSRRHAIFRGRDGTLEIEDLGSTNGTWVNEVRIESPTTLSDGDIVRFGGTSVLIISAQSRRPETVAAPSPMISGAIPDPPPPVAPPVVQGARHEAHPGQAAGPAQPQPGIGGPTGPQATPPPAGGWPVPPDDNPLDDVAAVLYLIAEQPNRRPKPQGSGWLFDGGEVFVVSDFLQFNLVNGIVVRQRVEQRRISGSAEPPSVEDLAWTATYHYSIEFPNGRALEVTVGPG